MNYAAIDAGATAYHKVEVPAYWAEATDDAAAESVTGHRHERDGHGGKERGA